MKTALILAILLLPLLSAICAEQGEQCTSHGQCVEGAACIPGQLTMMSNPYWGGISTTKIAGLMSLYKDEYDFGSTEESAYDYAKTYYGSSIESITYQALRKDRKSIITKKWPSNRPTKCYKGIFAVNCSKLKLKQINTSATCSLINRAPLGTDLTNGGPCSLKDWQAGIYKKRVYNHGQHRYYETKWVVKRKTFRFGARHILRYYYHNKNEDYGKTHFELIDTSCNASNMTEERCEITAEVMNTILNHLEAYRVYRAEKGYSPSGSKGFTLSKTESACKSDLQCYSYRCENNKCVVPMNMCSCAAIGQKLVSGTSQQCCQLDPSGTQTVFINPDTKQCSNEFVPREAFDDYTIKIVGDNKFDDLDFQSTAELSAINSEVSASDCEFEIKFDNPDDNILTQYQFTTGIDPSLSQEEILSKALDKYINNDYLIMMALEWLFIDTYRTCSPKRQDWKEDWATMMRTQIATHLQVARSMGSGSYISMTDAIKESVKRVTWSLTNKTDYSDYSTQKAFQDQIDIEVGRLQFENSILYGQANLTPTNKDSGLAKVILGSDPGGEKTTFKEISDRYNGVQYRWKSFLNAPDYFKCTSPRWDAWKLQGHAAWQARYKIKDTGFNMQEGANAALAILFPPAGVITFLISIFNPSDYFIDPPVHDDIKFDNSKWSSKVFGGTFLGNNTRKIKTGDMPPVMRASISNYYKIDEEQNEFAFLSTTDSEMLKSLLVHYSYQFFRYYSFRSGAKGHKVGGRVSNFFPRAEAAMLELNHYLLQLSDARKKRIQCLVHHKKQIEARETSENISLLGEITHTIDTEVVAPVDASTTGNNLLIENTPAPETTASSFDLEFAIGDSANSSSSASDLSSTSNTSGGGTSNSESTTGAESSSVTDDYRAAVEKRMKYREKLLTKLEKVNGKKAIQAVSREQKISTEGAKIISSVFSKGANGSSSSIYNNTKNPSSSNGSANDQDKIAAHDSDQTTSGTQGATGTNFNNIFGDSNYGSGSSSENGSNNMYADSIDPKTKEMLNNLNHEEKRGKYKDKESDTLFTKITKIYFRNAYRKLLNKKKSED